MTNQEDLYSFTNSEYRNMSPDPSIVFSQPDTFKDTRNVPRTRSLFLEMYPVSKWTAMGMTPIFTLKDEDFGPFRSLRTIYMTMADPTEYNFAMAVFGSYEYWNLICKSKWFQAHITVWRADLEAKLKSQAFETIKTIAVQTESPSTALQAAKFLLKEEWKGEGITKRAMAKDAKDKQDQIKKEKIGPTLSDSLSPSSDVLQSIQRQRPN